MAILGSGALPKGAIARSTWSEIQTSNPSILSRTFTHGCPARPYIEWLHAANSRIPIKGFQKSLDSNPWYKSHFRYINRCMVQPTSAHISCTECPSNPGAIAWKYVLSVIRKKHHYTYRVNVYHFGFLLGFGDFERVCYWCYSVSPMLWKEQ